MHDIKAIRDNPTAFDAGLKRRGLGALSPSLLAIDERRRAAILASEQAQARRNAASKEIGDAKKAKDEARAAKLMAEVAELKTTMPELEAAAKTADDELTRELSSIPNLPLDEVPDGTDEHGNVQHHVFGKARDYGFAPKLHDDLGTALGTMDFEAAAKLSGARFVVLKKGLARLERAIGQFMLDLHTGEHGYEILPRWSDAGPVFDTLLAEVTNAGGQPAGLGARDTLRTEMGYPLHGNDLGPEITPVMAGSAWAVGWDKDEFWGKEALTAQRVAKLDDARARHGDDRALAAIARIGKVDATGRVPQPRGATPLDRPPTPLVQPVGKAPQLRLKGAGAAPDLPDLPPETQGALGDIRPVDQPRPDLRPVVTPRRDPGEIQRRRSQPADASRQRHQPRQILKRGG